MYAEPIVKSGEIHLATTIKASHDMKLFATTFLSAATGIVLALSALTTFASGDAKPAAAAKPAAYKPDLAKGQASFASCAGCHNADGNSAIPGNPKLSQQHPEYLVKQLQEYKSGKRANAIMSGIAAGLSEEDMKNIAYWLTTVKIKPGAATDKDLAALGERIYRGGIQDRQIAACASCHGPSGAGVPSQYPRMAGQHAEYTAAQLTYFRDGIRKNNLQMTQVAAKLNDREIKALADYIAGLR
jgi:cytochrome c553